MSTLEVAVALGSNLAPAAAVGGEGEPRERALEFGIAELEAGGCRILARSAWIETEPADVPDEQPAYLNGCVVPDKKDVMGMARSRADAYFASHFGVN